MLCRTGIVASFKVYHALHVYFTSYIYLIIYHDVNFNLVLSAYNLFIQNLVLTKNNLTSLPDALFSSLKQLKIVDLSENILESIPGTIGQCDQMEILRIQDNNLADLPMELAQCTNLQVLNISRNLMNELPVVVPLCTSLEQLYMNDMFMTELPEEIGRKGLYMIWA